MLNLEFGVAVAWVSPEQRQMFLDAWGLRHIPEWLFLEQDKLYQGGAVTKNRATRRAIEAGAKVVVSLDDDCFPDENGPRTLPELAADHVRALAPQPVEMFEAVTDPPSRGTPYSERTIEMPVAASMGFWTHVGDYCALRQLAFGATHPMRFSQKAIHGRYFPLCGMNVAFRPKEWAPWCFLVEGVGRFDDIWMGWLWQKEAYRRGACFNLAGPVVRHSRQSNVWRNLRDEARLLEQSETLWRAIAASPATDYHELRAILPRAEA